MRLFSATKAGRKMVHIGNPGSKGETTMRFGRRRLAGIPSILLALMLGLVLEVSGVGAATMPTAWAVVPPGQTGWPADGVYTSAGRTVYQVGGDGALTPFVTLA